jgi:predicted nucleic acid-binding Zn ribbon protein
MARNIPRPRICVICGATYTATHSQQRYCSHPCWLEAERRRHRVGRPLGEAHPNAKLTASQVTEARALYRGRRGPSIRDLAAHYGIGYSAMWEALRGETWAHVA